MNCHNGHLLDITDIFWTFIGHTKVGIRNG